MQKDFTNGRGRTTQKSETLNNGVDFKTTTA